MFIISSKKIHFLENFRRPFLVISWISYISTIQNAAGTTTTAQVQLHSQFHLTFLTSFILQIFLFSTPALPNLQLQLHNCHFTTANYILQLQKLSSIAC